MEKQTFQNTRAEIRNDLEGFDLSMVLDVAKKLWGRGFKKKLIDMIMQADSKKLGKAISTPNMEIIIVD